MPRKAKSIGLHLVEGNKSNLTKKEIEKRKKNEEKLTPKSDNIKRPKWLKHDTVAQREWRKIVPELKRLGLLTNIDTTALAIYCEAVSKYVEAVENIKENGSLVEYTNTAGETNMVKNPAIHVKEKHYKIIKDMLKEFGLTPASRASLAINLEGDDDKAEDDEFSDI